MSQQIPSKMFQIPQDGGTSLLTLASNSRGLLFGCNNYGGYYCCFVYSDASGITNIIPIMTPSSNIVFDLSVQTKIKITNNGGRALTSGILIFYGSITIS